MVAGVTGLQAQAVQQAGEQKIQEAAESAALAVSAAPVMAPTPTATVVAKNKKKKKKPSATVVVQQAPAPAAKPAKNHGSSSGSK